jgi:putative transcriptional regulator
MPKLSPDAIAIARKRAGHTQAQAGAAVGACKRTWQDWELGQRSMPLSAWWLYLVRSGQATLASLPPIPERQRMAICTGNRENYARRRVRV